VHRKPIASIRQSPHSLSSSSLIVVASARRSLPRGSDRGSSDRDTPRPNPRRAIDLSRVPRRPRRRSRAAVSPRKHFPAFIPDVRRRRRRRAVHRVRVSVELPSDPRTRNRPSHDESRFNKSPRDSGLEPRVRRSRPHPRLVRSRASFATHPLRSGGVVHDDESALLRGDPNRLRRDEVGGRESLHHHLSKVSRARVCRCDGRDRTTHTLGMGRAGRRSPDPEIRGS